MMHNTGFATQMRSSMLLTICVKQAMIELNRFLLVGGSVRDCRFYGFVSWPLFVGVYSLCMCIMSFDALAWFSAVFLCSFL